MYACLYIRNSKISFLPGQSANLIYAPGILYHFIFFISLLPGLYLLCSYSNWLVQYFSLTSYHPSDAPFPQLFIAYEVSPPYINDIKVWSWVWSLWKGCDFKCFPVCYFFTHFMPENDTCEGSLLLIDYVAATASKHSTDMALQRKDKKPLPIPVRLPLLSPFIYSTLHFYLCLVLLPKIPSH